MFQYGLLSMFWADFVDFFRTPSTLVQSHWRQLPSRAFRLALRFLGFIFRSLKCCPQIFVLFVALTLNFVGNGSLLPSLRAPRLNDCHARIRDSCSQMQDRGEGRTMYWDELGFCISSMRFGATVDERLYRDICEHGRG